MKLPRLLLAAILVIPVLATAQSSPDDKIKKLKAEALVEIEKQYVLGQQINDMLFSFSELGFQEFETQDSAL